MTRIVVAPQMSETVKAAPRLDIVPTGNLGNQMLQYMMIQTLREKAPTVQVSGYDMPMWNLVSSAQVDSNAAALTLIGQYIDLATLSRYLRNGHFASTKVAALGFRMQNLPSCERCRTLFPAGLYADRVRAFNDDELVISVRGAETLGNVHEDYGPLPIQFYSTLVKATGLRPVFFGQLGQDRYSTLLRSAFPDAQFVTSISAETDFAILRRARHLVVSVSTFSWLAAWLSEARTIHLPLIGIFNPVQRPDIDLLPTGDPRYRFYRFPVRHWTASEHDFRALRAPELFPELDVDSVRATLERARRRTAVARLLYRLQLRIATITTGRLKRNARVGLNRLLLL